MRTLLKWTLITLTTLIVLLIAVALFMDWNRLRGPLEEALSEEVGRPVRIEGDLDVDILSLAPRVHIGRIWVANEPWAEHAMAEVDALGFNVPLWELLRGRLVLTDLTVDRPVLRLARNEAGEANWDFLVEEPAEEPLPVHRLTIREGRVSYSDASLDLELWGELYTDEERTHLTAQGSFRDEPASLEVTGGPLTMLQRGREPVPIQVNLRLAEHRLALEGAIVDPEEFRELSAQVSASSPDLSELLRVFDIPAPNIPPLEIAGRLMREGDTWHYQEVSGTLGESILEQGDLTIRSGREPLRVSTELVFEYLNFNDLADVLLVDKPEPEPPRERLFPDDPVPLDWLKMLDVDADLRSRQVRLWELSGEALGLTLTLDEGRLAMEPLTVQVAGGEINASLVMEHTEVPAFGLDIRLLQVALERLLAGTEAVEIITGGISGRVQLNGTGTSVAEALAVSEGRLGLVLSGGTLDHTVAEGIALNLLELLFGEGGPPQHIRCGAASFAIRKGVMVTELFVIDTELRVIAGEGSIDLGRETLNLELNAYAKDPGTIALQAPVQVEGRFLDPSVGVETGEVIARGMVAAILGALATPLAAVLPFIESGLAEDHDCRQLFDEADKAFAE